MSKLIFKDDITEIVAASLQYFERIGNKGEIMSASDTSIGMARYQTDAFFHNKVEMVVSRIVHAYGKREPFRAEVVRDAQQVPVSLPPIERDNDMGRTYIPIPGGYEIQTKGKGSTFRIAKIGGERYPIPLPDFVLDFLEQMAMDIRSAVESAAPSAPSQWQPIETAPKDGTVIDLLHKEYGRMCDAWWSELDGSWSATGEKDGFTHWMPQPPAPNATGKE